jgi:RNA polymerase sigma-70 factor, ECF subfamily
MGLGQSGVVQVLLRERIRICGAVLPVVRDAHAADDIFQQVTLQALQQREPFAEPDHVLAWALRAARHRAIDVARARKARCLDAATLDLLERQWAAHSAAEVSARVEALRQCLERLPESARALLRLRYDEGLPCAGVAERLRRSLDAVYQNLSRVHRQLRQCVEARLAEAVPAAGEVAT